MTSMTLEEFQDLGGHITLGDNDQFTFMTDHITLHEQNEVLYVVTFFESASAKVLYSGTCYENAFLIWDALVSGYKQGVRDEYKKSPWGVPVPKAEDSGSFTEGKEDLQENSYSMEDILNERDSGVYYYDGNIGGINREGVGRIPDWEWQGLTPSSMTSKIDAIDQSVLAKRKQLEEYESGI